MTNRRTKQEIALSIARRIKKPVYFQTAGNQDSYGQSCIAYPNGDMHAYDTLACEYFQARLKNKNGGLVTFDIYMEEQVELFNQERKKVNAVAYVGSKIDNYV